METKDCSCIGKGQYFSYMYLINNINVSNEINKK